jgi:elongation factor G
MNNIHADVRGVNESARKGLNWPLEGLRPPLYTRLKKPQRFPEDSRNARYTTEAIRTVALVGHGAAGKTSLAEALLVAAKAIPAPGSVEKGRRCATLTRSKRNSSILSAVRSCNLDHRDNARPHDRHAGLSDFLGQSLNALAAVETAAVVINAQNGVEMITKRMMSLQSSASFAHDHHQQDRRGERQPADLLEQIQARSARNVCPSICPLTAARKVVDCFFNPAGESDFSSVADAHRALVEQVVKSTRS